MVKAYLRYTQERVLGALVGNKSNIKLVKVQGTEGKFMATGCNEVVNLTNLRTGEVEYQIYDREAVHGEVTCLAASTTLLAVGYSDGAVLIFDLGELNQSPTQMLVSPFEQVHCFEFHRSAVTALIFSDENTQLVSGSTDTYIVLYDLVTSTAEYKLMGHTEPITQLQTLVTRHPTRGTPLRSLVSASKDGLLKVWDLEKQQCVGTFGDAAITKINDFVLIAELSLLVAAGTDNKLVIFIVESNEQVSLKLNSTTFVKDSNHRAIQLHYDRKRQVLMVLSADNKMEAFSVNVDKPESILRKLQRQTKKSLKRTHSEANEEPKCDKEELQSKIAHKDYDLAIHFRKSAVWVVDAVNKARSFAILPGKNFDCVVAFHNNRCVHYELKLEQTDNLKHLATIGEMQTHQMAIRGVAVSPNDALFATHSMDCIKVWTVDLFESNQSGELTIQCRQNLNEQNIIAITILPGNKFIVLGSKEGQLSLYDMNANIVIQRLQAHTKEIWEVAYHTNPQGLKGSLLVASASADRTIKFHTLGQKSDGNVHLTFYEKIETTDEVMGVKFSPNGQFFVFSLLDSTLKVCYVDTMKLLLNLYGHKLPVLSFDISSDGNLLATGSADKNLKIWGMQFGDIHKSMFIHQDSITCVRFIRDTHYCVTSSKDREVKLIDCDTYDEVFVWDTFYAEVWSVAVSSIGDYFIAVSADRGVRVWKQTSEQAFVTDEQEHRQEKQMLKDAGKDYTEIDIAMASQVDPFAKDKVLKIESAQVTQRSAETIKYGDDLMYALELAEQWRDEVEQYAIGMELFERKMGPEPERPKASIHFLGRTIYDHILLKLKQIRAADLDSTLRFLNYTHSCSLLFYIEHYIRNNIEIELSCRVAMHLLKDYQVQLQQRPEVHSLLASMNMHMKHYFKESKQVIGKNLCALQVTSRQMDQAREQDFMTEPPSGFF